MDFKYPTQEYFKFTIIMDIRSYISTTRFLLTSSTIFHKNFTRFSYCQPCKIFKLIVGSILNDWKHLKLLKNLF